MQTHCKLVAPLIVTAIGVEYELQPLTFELQMGGPPVLPHLSVTFDLNVFSLWSELQIVIPGNVEWKYVGMEWKCARMEWKCAEMME